jgi:hypothetical protein
MLPCKSREFAFSGIPRLATLVEVVGVAPNPAISRLSRNETNSFRIATPFWVAIHFWQIRF